MTGSANLGYTDEQDRSYGLAGMALALVLWDGESYLSSISLDSPVGYSLEFSPAFGFSGNPRMSATYAWREMVKQFEISVAMILGNVMSRSYIGRSQPMSDDDNVKLRAYLRREGSHACQLDEDETDLIYNKTRRYLDRAFTHSGVSLLIHDLVRSLTEKRRLSSAEIIDIFSELNRL